jgi:tetratricopeptide (TPR) repeat protein
LNPDNPRPHIGLGGVYFKRARDKLEDSLTLVDRADSLRAAFDESGRAISEYEIAVSRAQIHDNSDLPLEAIARLGLGNATRLRGDILLQQGDYESAGAAIDQAIVDLRQTLVPLGDAELDRYLAQAFEYLGGTFTTLGALSEIGQDFEGSLEAYQTALNYYDQCIELGNQSLDLIIQREIAEKICIPGQQAVQEILDDFSGGQG